MATGIFDLICSFSYTNQKTKINKKTQSSIMKEENNPVQIWTKMVEIPKN